MPLLQKKQKKKSVIITKALKIKNSCGIQWMWYIFKYFLL